MRRCYREEFLCSENSVAFRRCFTNISSEVFFSIATQLQSLRRNFRFLHCIVRSAIFPSKSPIYPGISRRCVSPPVCHKFPPFRWDLLESVLLIPPATEKLYPYSFSREYLRARRKSFLLKTHKWYWGRECSNGKIPSKAPLSNITA